MLSIKKHPILAASVLIADALAILVSFFLAYQLRFSGSIIPVHKGIPSLEAYFRAMVVVTPVYLLIFRAYQLYRPERHVRRIHELLDVAKAITMATIFLMASTFIYREFSYSRVVLLLAWIISIFLCCLGRYFLIQVEYFIRLEKDRDRILVIGTNRNARNLIRWTKGNPHYGQEIVGLLAKYRRNGGKHVEGVSILGSVEDLDEAIEKERVDGVIVTDPGLSREEVGNLMLKCENKMIDFKLAADFYGLMTRHGIESASA